MRGSRRRVACRRSRGVAARGMASAQVADRVEIKGLQDARALQDRSRLAPPQQERRRRRRRRPTQVVDRRRIRTGLPGLPTGPRRRRQSHERVRNGRPDRAGLPSLRLPKGPPHARRGAGRGPDRELQQTLPLDCQSVDRRARQLRRDLSRRRGRHRQRVVVRLSRRGHRPAARQQEVRSRRGPVLAPDRRACRHADDGLADRGVRDARNLSRGGHRLGAAGRAELARVRPADRGAFRSSSAAGTSS